MAFLKFEDIDKSFGQNNVISKFNLEVEKGKFIVLLGPSGCGKSTLLRMIAGLEKIDNGKILLENNLLNDLLPSKRQIAMVFQSYALYPHMSVFENISFGLKSEKISKNDIKNKVIEAAKILKIEELLERRPRELSGGQRQRVAIGRAITRKPKVFLFDEPLSNLDAALRVQMRVELAKLHNELEATMIYVTHDQTEAMTLADDIVVLDTGIVSQKGSPLELYDKPNNMFVGGFIGSPKMNFISSKITSKSGDKTEVDIMGASKIAVPKMSASSSEGDSVTLGIRPEHLLVNQDSDGTWESKVFVVEKLGSGTFLYLEKDGEPLVVETEGHSEIKVGDTVKVGFPSNRCHLFDSSQQAFK